MKKIFFAVLFCLALAGTTQAQLRKIPSDVTNSFKAKFPSATNVEWKDKLTSFQASFREGSTDMTASFNTKGEWQATEKAISPAEVPAAVTDGFKKSKYASPTEWKRGDVVTVITKNDKSTQYRIYVDKIDGIQKKYLYFNTDGQLQKEALTL